MLQYFPKVVYTRYQVVGPPKGAHDNRTEAFVVTLVSNRGTNVIAIALHCIQHCM